MVIGNGMIANRFISYKNNDDVIIFASGVSNSKDTIEENFLREFCPTADIDGSIKGNIDLCNFFAGKLPLVIFSKKSKIIHA
ncbi:MAG: hypothetical protein ABIY62_00460 [Ginsengibacter sp.]